MDLSKFVISLMFDDKKTAESAKKVETVVNDLKSKIVSSFSSLGTIDFLKNIVEKTQKIATELDNLSYITNINKETLAAWGQAVERNGGTAQSFYNSISGLSEKIREMQTNVGTAGQAVFQRLGIHLGDSTGKAKNAVQILEELSEKIRNFPKVWQMDFGRQLGLDNNTIRLITSGKENINKLVQQMKEQNGVQYISTEQSIKYRNAMKDLANTFESVEIIIAVHLIPILNKATHAILTGLKYLEHHTTLAKIALGGLAAVLGGSLATAISAAIGVISGLTVVMTANPIFLYASAISAVVLALNDLYNWYSGKGSVLKDFFSSFSPADLISGDKTLHDKIDLKSSNSSSKRSGSVLDTIKNAANSIGLDADLAATIANIESSLNPNAKSNRSSASGLFQLTDQTAMENGIFDLSSKNDATTNAIAGIKNLKKISSGLNKFFGRNASGSEIYLGEMLGLSGAKTLFSSNPNSMLSSLFSRNVINSNPQLKNMSAGQLINQANKTYANKSVHVGEVNVHTQATSSNEISKNISSSLQQQLMHLVTNVDNGVLA